jgi:aspartate/methionine/tyrosine aminotransferase
MSPRPVPPFRYMEWAKARSPGPRYNLAQSGSPSISPQDLDLSMEDIRFKQDGGYGDRGLLAALSARYGVPEDEIVPASGSSLANALVTTALLSEGDLVLVEKPCYESLATLPRLLGAEVRFVTRRFEHGFALPVEDLEAGFADGARLAILTDSHNPTGAPAGDEAIAAVAGAAARTGAHVMVDEVYRDFRPGDVSSTRSLAPGIIATSSLTKVYGLGGLRAGWVFAPADLTADMHRLHDYWGVNFPTPVASITVAALGRIDAIRARFYELGRRGWEIASRWFEARDDLEVVAPGPGLICFPRITSGVSSQDLVDRLESRHDTTVVPGEYFEMPGYFRLGFGLDEEILREGLNRVGLVLDELRQSL